MKITIPGCIGEQGIFSIALDETTRDDLSRENIRFLYISPEDIVIYPDKRIISTDEKVREEFAEKCNNYDVFEITGEGKAFRCYDDSSNENIFFITEQCNSNCIMCPSPVLSRKNGTAADIDRLIEIARHIPSDVSHMTITGGEPFMAGKQIFKLLGFCKKKFVDTEFQILTNGRIFSVSEYCDLIKENLPDYCTIGIPIHGANDQIHDRITQVKGSFDQTVTGITRLQRQDINTEIRIVVLRDNVENIQEIAELITRKMPKTSYVSIMAMELTGNAFLNADRVWVSYRESFRYIRDAVNVLMKAGINVRLYNYPLCAVDSDMRTLCYRSISSWKVRYSQTCDKCNEKASCGGVFAGSLKREQEELEAII